MDKNAYKIEDIKISKDFYVPRNNIRFYCSYKLNWAVNYVREKKKEEGVIDLTGNKATGTVVILQSGEVILTSVSSDTIFTRMNGRKQQNSESEESV